MILAVSKIIKETHNTVTLQLDLAGQKIEFIPGQFVLVSSSKSEKPVKRAYSIANSPVKGYLELTIKEVPNGALSGCLTKQIKIGDKLELSEPLGKIFLLNKKQKKITLIGAGSGIVPLRCMIQYIINNNLKTKVILLDSNKTPEDIIYRKEFEKYNKLPNIKIVHTITRLHLSKEKWNGLTGRININLITQYNKKLAGEFYLCGPPVFVKDIKALLVDAGVPAKHIKGEMY